MSNTRLDKLQTFLAESPDDSFLLFALAKEYEGTGKAQKALETYLRLQETNEQYIGLYYHLGKLYEQLEQAQPAWDTYCKGMAIAKAEGDQHAYSELAGARLNLGNEEDFE